MITKKEQDSMIDLKFYRESKKLSKRELAKMSEISPSYITELEKGDYDPNIKIICKLCKALRITPNDLIKKEYWE